MTNILFSLSIAVGIPALILGLLALSPIFLLYAVVIGWMHAVFLALPTFLILNRFNLANVYTSSLSGFVIAAVPFGVWQLPKENLESKTNAYTSGFGQTMIDGVPTRAGWFEYMYAVATFGCIGLIAGLIFWFTLKRVKSEKH